MKFYKIKGKEDTYYIKTKEITSVVVGRGCVVDDEADCEESSILGCLNCKAWGNLLTIHFAERERFSKTIQIPYNTREEAEAEADKLVNYLESFMEA